MVPKNSNKDNNSTKDSQATGTRVEVTLPMNQTSGFIPPVYPPHMVNTFNQPSMISPGLFGGMAPMAFPGSIPVPNNQPNIIVTVPNKGNRNESKSFDQGDGTPDSSNEKGNSDQTRQEYGSEAKGESTSSHQP